MEKQDYLKENGVNIQGALELLGDMDTYDEILQEFFDHIEERREKLKNYLNDMNNYEIEVHALKSDSKYLGFSKLADMALEHQNKSHDGDMEFVTSHYQELDNEINHVISIISKYIEG